MQPELLLFDIGNTSIKVGLANERHVLTSYTLPANAGHTSDSLGLTLLSLLRHADTDMAKLKACVASSVVPGFDPLLREAVARYLDRPLYCAPDDLPIPLENRYERPSEVGADRLVGAFAARRLCPDAASLLVVDFGTAVTFDCVSGQAYLGGLSFRARPRPWPRCRAKPPNCPESIWTFARKNPRPAATPPPASSMVWSLALSVWWRA